MTAKELEDTFCKCKPSLMNFVRRRYKILQQDAVDILQDTYVSALGGKEYEKVPLGMARKWWYYKVSRKAVDHVNRAVGEMKALQTYQQDPTTTNQFHEDLMDSDAMELLQEYWEGLTRYTQSRMRQQWAEEGREWLPFMHPKHSGRS